MQNQRGFVGIGVLIAILVGLTVLGGRAYYAVHQQSASQATKENYPNLSTQQETQTQNTNSPAEPSATKTPAAKPTTPTPPISNKSYTNTKYGFNIQYPADLVLETKGLFGVSAVVGFPLKSTFFTSDVSVQVASDASSVVSCGNTPVNEMNPNNDAGTTVINGVSFHTYTHYEPATAQEFGSKTYTTIHNNQCFSLVYAWGGVHENHLSASDDEIYKRDMVAAHTKLDPIIQSFRFVSQASSDWQKYSYAKRGNQIFYTGSGQNEVELYGDVNTFVALSGSEMSEAFAKDNVRVWRGATIIANADPASFAVLDAHQGIAADKNTLYFPYPGYTQLLRSDALTFSVLADYTVGGTFLKSNNSLYFWDKTKSTLTLEPNGDASTFQVIRAGGDYEPYAKDKNNVYCVGKVLAGADATTFRIADNFTSSTWVQDKNHNYDGQCNVVQ